MPFSSSQRNQSINQSINQSHANRYSFLYILLIAIASISLFSHSSPLYPFNIWVDPNCFFTVGKSVLDGVVPYRDLYEQKGSLLYFLHTLAALISYRSFFGVYLLEILAAFAFLSISYKSISLLHSNKYSIPFLFLISLIIYSSPTFVMGDSAEEFCLPLIAYALYIGLKSITTRIPITRSQAFVVGLTVAAVLWIKYTMVGFYIGWMAILIYIYIKHMWQSRILSTIVFAIIGLIALTLPIFAYFAYHNALDTMLNVYFLDNAKYYSGYTSLLNLLHTIKNNIVDSYNSNIYLWILIICGLVFAGTKKQSAYLLISFFSLILFIFIRFAMPYYSFILSVFAPLGIVLLISLFQSTKTQFSYSIATLITLNIVYNTISGIYIFKPTEDLAQHQFDKIIQSESNPTLLNYGFLDGGFYTYSGLIPSNRFFCRLNIPIPEMMQEQDSIIANQEVMFIVTLKKNNLPNYDFQSEFTGYQKVAVAQHPLKTGGDAIYTLHKRIANPEVSE